MPSPNLEAEQLFLRSDPHTGDRELSSTLISNESLLCCASCMLSSVSTNTTNIKEKLTYKIIVADNISVQAFLIN